MLGMRKLYMFQLVLMIVSLLQGVRGKIITQTPANQSGIQNHDIILSNDDDDRNSLYSVTFYTIQKVDDNIYYSQISSLDGLNYQNVSDITKVSMTKSSNNLIGITNQQQQSKNNQNQYQIYTQNIQVKSPVKPEILGQDKKQPMLAQSNQLSILNTSKQIINISNKSLSAAGDKNLQYEELTPLFDISPINNQLIQNLPSIISSGSSGPKFTKSSISLKVRPTRNTIIDRQWANVGLYHQVPEVFVTGEVYHFSGIVTNEQTIKTQPFKRYDRVNIAMIGVNRSSQFKCTEQNPQSLQFNISCKMQATGRYFMSIFVGNTGKSSYTQRKIVPLPNLNLPQIKQQDDIQPKGLRLQVVNNSLYVVWDSKANLTNLTIYQEYNGTINKIQYLLSNNHEKYKIQYKDFNDFLPTTTYIQISHAMSKDGTLNIIYTKFSTTKAKIQFEALDHAFDTKSQNAIIKPQIPWKVEVGQKITFNIQIKQDLKSIVYITQPDLKLRKMVFVWADSLNQEVGYTTTIMSGVPVSLTMTFTKPGTHIVQINNAGGLAVLNRPVYVGIGYPLIPDFKDLVPISYNPRSNISFERIYEAYYSRTTEPLKIRQPPKNSSEFQKIQYLLTLLNGLRNKYRLSPLQLDSTLYKIAKNHSDDMVQRGYFGHANPEGLRSKDRAKKYNITNLVGQNIAQTNFLTENHLGLQRSATHLEAMIGPSWTRIGIGINITKSGQYIVTYIFSTRDLNRIPVTPQQLQLYHEKLFNLIVEKNPKIKQQNKQITDLIKEWMVSDRKIPIMQYLYGKKGNKINLQGVRVTVGFSEDWVERLLFSSSLSGYQFYQQTSIGIGMKQTDPGSIEVFVVFS